MQLDARCVARAVSTLAAEVAVDLHRNHGYTKAAAQAHAARAAVEALRRGCRQLAQAGVGAVAPPAAGGPDGAAALLVGVGAALAITGNGPAGALVSGAGWVYNLLRG